MYQLIEGAEVTKSGKKVTIKDAQKLEGSEIDIIGKTKDEVKEIVVASEPNATCK